MSCHNIGYALNHVQKKVIELYEAEKIEKEVARELLIRCVDSVGMFCDGNETEATLAFDKHYCSECMNKQQEDDALYDICYGSSFDYRKFAEYKKKNLLIGTRLCKTCFEKMLKEFGVSNEEIDRLIREGEW